MFFYVGLNFVLRGVQEQQDLIPSQFGRVPQDRSVYNAKFIISTQSWLQKIINTGLRILMHRTRSIEPMLCQEIPDV